MLEDLVVFVALSGHSGDDEYEEEMRLMSLYPGEGLIDGFG